MAILLHILAAGVLTRVLSISVAALLSCRWLAGPCGLLAAVALTHLMPEAFEMPGVEAHDLGLVMLGTVVLFLILERIFTHHGHEGREEGHPGRAAATAVMTGAGLHNFVDGVLIASTFLMDERAGWLVALAVCCHEIPQATGYMVILKNCGLDARRAVLWCVAAALPTLAGGVAGWAAVSFSREALPFALAASAASFLFITLHALLPEVFRDCRSKREGFRQLLLFAAGVLLSTVILGIGHGHDHDNDHEGHGPEAHEYETDAPRVEAPAVPHAH